LGYSMKLGMAITVKSRNISGKYFTCPECKVETQIQKPLTLNSPYCGACGKSIEDAAHKFCGWCGVGLEDKP
jgi:transcription elongation factor Elf1